jgi:XTP/dITP diphosphohydrolase
VSGRVVLLVTSPAVRPGLLSWPAWQTLSGAAQVLAPSMEHPLLPYLDEAGIGWAVLPGAAGAGPGELARRLSAAAAGQPGAVVWLPAPDPLGSVDHDGAGPAGAGPAGAGPAGAGPAGAGPAGTVGAGSLGAGSVAAGGVAALACEVGHGAEIVHGSAGLPGAELLVLVEVMDTLRRHCPWDAKQTHESLAPFLLEESYEALDALESGDRAALREELGDVLLQVMFHARVAAERTDGTGFTIDDVADGIVSKLVRRHPHVFADVAVSGAEDVKRNWDEIKAAEREAKSGAPTSALDGVPLSQPALVLAAQLQRRAERAGIPAGLADFGAAGADGHAGEADGPGADGDEPGGDDADGDEADGDEADMDGGKLGGELFALVASARAAGLDPELELRAAARRYRDRVRAWERDTGRTD